MYTLNREKSGKLYYSTNATFHSWKWHATPISIGNTAADGLMQVSKRPLYPITQMASKYNGHVLAGYYLYSRAFHKGQ